MVLLLLNLIIPQIQIQDFYDKRGISYGSSETKVELLSRIVGLTHRGNQEVSKHIKV